MRVRTYLCAIAALALAVDGAAAGPRGGGKMGGRGGAGMGGGISGRGGGIPQTPGTPGALDAEVPLDQELAVMTRELKLTDAQQAAIKEKLTNAMTTLSTWDKINGPKLAGAKQDLKLAQAAKDTDAVKKAEDLIAELQANRDKILPDAQEKVLGELTADQKTAWIGFRFFCKASAAFRNTKLTEQQSAKLRALCDDAAKKLDAGADKSAQRDALVEVINAARDKLLTQAQRQLFGRRLPGG
jgi:hypothetical protein